MAPMQNRHLIASTTRNNVFNPRKHDTIETHAESSPNVTPSNFAMALIFGFFVKGIYKSK